MRGAASRRRRAAMQNRFVRFATKRFFIGFSFSVHSPRVVFPHADAAAHPNCFSRRIIFPVK
jgi:hypothetical protein